MTKTLRKSLSWNGYAPKLSKPPKPTVKTPLTPIPVTGVSISSVEKTNKLLVYFVEESFVQKSRKNQFSAQPPVALESTVKDASTTLTTYVLFVRNQLIMETYRIWTRSCKYNDSLRNNVRF